MRSLHALTALPGLARQGVVAAVVALALAACGGGGGGSAAVSGDGGTPAPGSGPGIPLVPTMPDSGPQTASGTTFADVLVCADLDGDGQCSASEQTSAATLSSPTGTYTLSWTGRAGAPLLALLTVAGPGTAPASSSTPLACLDANGNQACDAGEAATNSHQAGLYQLTVPVGQSDAGLYFPLSPAFTPAAAPQTTAGNRHLTVRWPAVAGALDYEVWYQQAGTSAITLSRAAIPAAGTRVHTITSLDNTRRFRVWVKARLAGGAFGVMAAPSAAPVSQTASTPSQVPGFVPATINLPVLDISTQGGAPVTSLENYVTATFSLFADGAARAAATPQLAGSLDIRGRGNSTWMLFEKKPYRLRLGSAAALLGMPSNRHWVLLANHGDKSLLRNETIFELSRRVGMAWTPRSRFVEVFQNGNYLGNYELAEHLRTGSNRVNIASLGTGDNAEPAVTGGYLLELDWPAPDTTFTTSRCGLPVRIDTPEAPTTQQRAWIQAYMESVETALNAPDFADVSTGYASLLNVDTFVDWYLINELSMNRDSFRASTWFYKDRNAKLAIGPVWDYDLALGNNILLSTADPGTPTAMSALGGTCWYRRLLADPAFVQKVRNRWQTLRTTQLASLPDFVDAQAALLTQSHANNFGRWPVLDKGTFPVVVVPRGVDGEVEYLRWWLQRRIEWLDTRWGP